MIEAIAFDLDGTLFDRQQAAARYWQRLAERFAEVGSKHFKTLAQSDTGEPDSAANIRRYLSASGLKQSCPSLLHLIDRTFTDRIANQLEPNLEVRAMIERLSQRYTVALITNGRPQTQRNKLSTIGMADLFQEVLISGEVGVSKPDAAIFKAVSDRVGIPPGRMLMVGDDFKRDILGAHGVGMLTAWLSGGRPTPLPGQADIVLEDLLELEQALR